MLALANLIVTVALTAAPQAIEKKDILGCWQRSDESPEQMMRFEEKRFINVGKDYQQIIPVLYEKGKVILAPPGGKHELQLTLKSGVLTVKNDEGKTETYKKLPNVPAELDFSPLKLGASKTLPEPK